MSHKDIIFWEHDFKNILTIEQVREVYMNFIKIISSILNIKRFGESSVMENSQLQQN